MRSVVISTHQIWGRSGGVSQDRFVSRYIRDWCNKNPGVGTRLQRIGSGSTQAVSNLGGIRTDVVPYSQQFLCLIDAVVQASIELQHKIGEDGQVHYFPTCSKWESPDQDASKNFFSVVSIFYYSDLLVNSRVSMLTVQALCFLIQKHYMTRKKQNIANNPTIHQ